MTTLLANHVTDSLASPCCLSTLTVSGDGAVCGGCGALFPMRAYGLDLVPADLAEREPAYQTWTAVQNALTAWRARTWVQSDDAEARTRETKRMAAAFLEMTGVAGRVLDVGCGSGWIRQTVVERSALYGGVDPMPTAESYPFPFARAVSDRLPFGDGCFDSLMFFSSLDYSLSLDDTLTEAGRVLVPGGVLAIATPIHATREATGERLHHHRFLAGDLEAAIDRVLGVSADTHVWQRNYHFVWARRR